MGQVLAQIQLLVDFHAHDGGTALLAALPPATREAFLTRCAESLHGGRLSDFLLMHQDEPFRIPLEMESGTSQPSLASIKTALSAAVVHYNEQGFGLRFDPEFGAHGEHLSRTTGTALALTNPPFACVQWVWINGEWVKKFNYDLRVIGGTPPSEGELEAGYRVALTYTS